ncbi:acyl-CoA thioesterase II [Hahella sp. HN01]|uniref:acyl-CoA thioesterase n=1 Tax=Hahella sp. HN01 TaxID=2847262 RepID=UPI001C1F0F77|nr:thioesterase family protein [Hahella sp. HN01]MBU6950075.1 thioesterase family protein [Hahella sp. HN01]
MLFSKLLGEVSDSVCDVEIAEDWSQGRSTFGGLVAAFIYEAMRQSLSEDRPLREFNISFVSPVAPTKLTVASELLREGGSVSQVLGRAIQQGEVKATAFASFGKARDTIINASGEATPEAKAPDQCIEMPYIKGVTPEFTQHFNYYYAYGNLPFSGVQSREMGGWVRFRQPEPAITLGHILGLVDAWPPATLPWVKAPAPASTLTWSIQFPQPTPSIQPDELCLYKAYVEHASEGYAYTRSKLWNAKGELVALSQQTVTVFG